jgi:hypothetical protein
VETYSIAVHRPVKELGVSRVRAARTNGFATREDMVTPNEFVRRPSVKLNAMIPPNASKGRPQTGERAPGGWRGETCSGLRFNEEMTGEGAIAADEWIGNTAKDARQEIWRQAG